LTIDLDFVNRTIIYLFFQGGEKPVFWFMMLSPLGLDKLFERPIQFIIPLPPSGVENLIFLPLKKYWVFMIALCKFNKDRWIRGDSM